MQGTATSDLGIILCLLYQSLEFANLMHVKGDYGFLNQLSRLSVLTKKIYNFEKNRLVLMCPYQQTLSNPMTYIK